MYRYAVVILVLATFLSSATGSETKPRLEKPSSFLPMLECMMCAYSIQEIEGFIAENHTKGQIIKYVEDRLCQRLKPTQRAICNTFAELLPLIINFIDGKLQAPQICMKLGLCSSDPLPHTPDWTDIPEFVFDLDLPPEQRWKNVIANANITAIIKQLWTDIQTFFNPELLSWTLNLGGGVINRLRAPFPAEIQGAANLAGIPANFLALLNMAYDLTDACTSILTAMPDGTIMHARNLDFAFGLQDSIFLRQIVLQLDVRRGGKTLFKTVGFPLYSGVLTGFKDKAFTLTVNTRFLPEGPIDMIKTALEFLLNHDAVPVTYLTREVMENATSYAQAASLLQNSKIIADVYYTLGGYNPYEGAVITRDREKARDVWQIVSPNWYVVQTNNDHWLPPPWYDNRVEPAKDALESVGRDGLSQASLFEVLSTVPVLNLKTIHSIVMSARASNFATFRRFCKYPCPF